MAVELPLTSREEAAHYRALGLWRDQTPFEYFAAVAARTPEKAAVVQGNRRYRYAELGELIENLAGNLVDLGLEPGSVVALQAANCVHMPLIHLACYRAGLLYLPLHDSWREVEIRHLLQRAKARMMIVPIEYRGYQHAKAIHELRAELPELAHLVTLEGTAHGSRDFGELLKPSRVSAQALDARRPDPDLPAHTMLSGGTTALSKISRFTSNDLMVLLDNFANAAELSENDVIAALAPAGTGATGYVYPILAPLLRGATSVILERWGDPEEALELIRKERCTGAVGIPTQLTLMVPPLEKRSPRDFPQFRLFFNAGAPLPYDTGFKIEALMDCKIQSLYGATDGGVPSVTTLHDSKDKRLTTVGRIVPGCECELRDADGKPVAPGQAGEIAWRSADKSWGYLGDDEQTALAFTQDRFYKSGDLGQFDSDGYLRIVGRVKDMILRGGRNIFPLTIEEQLIKHPAVVEVAVTSMPDPILGERACAFVLLREGRSLTLAQAVEFLKEQKLAVFQLPERLEIMDDLPRGPGGKVQKAKLTELVTAKLRAEGKLAAR